MSKEIRGIVAAALTPMHPDGQLNLSMVKPVVDSLIRDGVRSVFVCGSTGEGLLLTSAERRAVAETYIQAADGRIPVIIQVGSTSPVESRDLAAHAQAAGADAISALAPSYFKPSTPDILVDVLADIASGAPALPFYYYHLPSWTGVDLGMLEVLRLSQQRIPSFGGVKFSSINLVELQACLAEYGDRYTLLFGVDEIYLAGLMFGAHGAVGSTYNFLTPQNIKVTQLFEQGCLEEARQLQARLGKIIGAIVRYRGHAGLKAVMQFVGLDCGPTRMPIRPLNPGETAALRSELEILGFFELVTANPAVA
jgi:N-acetylneuraminate lyase